MDLEKIGKSLAVLNISDSWEEQVQAIIDIRSEGKEVEFSNEFGCYCASGVYVKATVEDIFRNARRYGSSR